MEGPKIKGKIIAPAADWLHVMPSGVSRVDVRLTIRTDDGQLLFMTYRGAPSRPAVQVDSLGEGATIKVDDFYFIMAPTFETNAARYVWINTIQSVGKMTVANGGEAGFARYDIFSVK